MSEDFLSTLLRAASEVRIRAFIAEVMRDPSLSAELSRRGVRPETAAAVARERGHDIDAEEIEAWIEHRMTRLPAWIREMRDDYAARRAAGRLPEVVVSDVPTPAVLRELDWCEGFVLDRRTVLEGEVVLLRGVPALERLATRLSGHIAAALAPTEPAEAFHHIDATDLPGRVAAANAAITADGAIVPAMVGLIDALGLPAEDTVWEWPGCRLIPPAPDDRGFYRDHGGGAVGPHRDTWYGSPRHQINVWSPLWQLPPGDGIVVLPAWYRRSMPNSSAGYDLWLRALGLTLAPVALEEPDESDALALRPAPGDAVIFAGQHLHRSGTNRGHDARGSLELRLLHEPDAAADWLPANVDFHGFGEIFENWFDHAGRPVRRHGRGE